MKLGDEPRGKAAFRKRYLRRWGLGFVMALSLYVGSYVVLSEMGRYCYTQSGLVRFDWGLSADDLIMWRPRYIWYQDNFTNIYGKTTSRGDFGGYFYSPLIRLDRRFVHPTMSLRK